jgi:hypothetical protein
MYRNDTDAGTISPEDARTYQELIGSQRASHIATQVEVKDASTGETSTVEVRSLGGAALENALAVHSSSWVNEEK